ncbi:MAG: tRNA adenosine(34) deaminase TadA [Gemmatimonadota bacterium]
MQVRGSPASPTPADIYWMRRALARAELALERGEVPVGAVVVADGAVIGAGWNATETRQDATAHAELLALQQAAAATGSRRLSDSTLYVTLEPCAMCAGAIVLARVGRLVFGAYDPKGGACGTVRNVVEDPRLNHCCRVRGGVLESECAGQLQAFFARLRAG